MQSSCAIRSAVAHSIGLWAVTDGRLQRVSSRQVDRERRLEDWIESHPDILGERLLIVDRQVKTRFGGIIDLLAIDDEGRCVVIELKRGRTPRDIVAQALDYVSCVAQLTDSEVRDLTARISGRSFNEAYHSRFGTGNVPEQVNSDQRILIVATDVDEATSRIVEHLTKRYGVDINVVSLSYFTIGEQEMLARSWLVEPVELEERVDSRVTVEEENALAPPGLWHVNVGVHPNELIQRNWDDPMTFGFLSAGQGAKWRDEISRLGVGDHVYAYLNGHGYVGGGVVTSSAVRADGFVPPGYDKPLRELPLESQGWFTNSDDPELAEYMVGIHWDKAVPAMEGLRVLPLRGTVRRIKGADRAATLHAAFG